MPVFSFTAPHVTPEQEKEERENLSNQMRQELQKDLYGEDHGEARNEPAVDETDKSWVADLLAEMEDVIENEITLAKKKDFLIVKSKVPHLIKLEAKPISFLRCEKYNAKAAAYRMTSYWRIRSKLFGKERAFLPMTLTGAMKTEEELLETGLCSILPKDRKHRGVISFDRIRAIPPLAPREKVLRVLFYILHALSEDEELHKLGYVCMMNIKGYDLYKHFDRILTKTSATIMMECMPVKLKAYHLLAGCANGVVSLVLPVMKHVVEKEVRLRMVVHSGGDGKVLETIQPYGLGSQNISQCVGGDFSHSDFLEWLENWKQRELYQSKAHETKRVAKNLKH